MTSHPSITRRDVLRGMMCVPASLLAGCGWSGDLPFIGRLVGPNAEAGHRLRAGIQDVPSDLPTESAPVVIVGAGIAGLSAAYELKRSGITPIVVELEERPGGTAQSDRSSRIAYPWGAHYLPLPMPHNTDLLRVLEAFGVVTGYDDRGEPQVAEEMLCRDPEERVWAGGRWYEGLYPGDDASDDEQREWARFQAEVGRWADWRDAQGRRAFAIPVAESSSDPTVWDLDQITMAQWLEEHEFQNPKLRWLVDYACRDDYGLRTEQTSAWAGLFYFAARLPSAEQESRPLLTWPSGNGWLVERFRERLGGGLHCGEMAVTIRPGNSPTQPGLHVLTWEPETGHWHRYETARVIFAAPSFLRPYVIDDEGQTEPLETPRFSYGAWFVANLHLHQRPRETGFPLCWDNVIYESPSLGYVVATHQRGLDYGPTVWTYYYPFCHDDAAAGRRELWEMTWEDCARLVLSDLEPVHPDLRSCLDRLDVMRWGHAMVQPRPGVLGSESRLRAQRPWQGVHFAHTDLSGLALFEEAFFHGTRAAREVLAALDDVSDHRRDDPHAV